MRRLSLLVITWTIAGAAHALSVDRIAVSAVAGKSITTWHGQADVQLLNVELSKALSPRSDAGFVLAPVSLWQPRSWFGDQFGDGNETVRAISGSLLVRRNFRVDAPTLRWFVEGSTGPMWAEKRVPASTSRFNFISQIGAGVVLRPHTAHPLTVGYRFIHISNGGYAPRNPGLNIFTIVAGVEVRSARRR
ncbi:MAG TPA: acyloxyacyl hydrolase [Thermoanaerobaculia bacterium]|jgi:hypothetical protein